MSNPITGGIAKVTCSCGHAHLLKRDRVIDGVGQATWKCSECLRHFVIVHEPPSNGSVEKFFAFFVDYVAAFVNVRHTRQTVIRRRKKAPAPPPMIPFACRCGVEIQCHSFMYGKGCNCESCGVEFTPMVVWDIKKRDHRIAPKYVVKSN